MHTIKRFAFGFAVTTLLFASQPGSALAQDASLSGTWTVSIDSPEAASQMTWTIEHHEDGSITGTSSADMIGESEILDGWVDGDAFGFTLFAEAQGEAFDILFEGTFTADEVLGDLDVGGGMFSAPFSGVREDGGLR